MLRKTLAVAFASIAAAAGCFIASAPAQAAVVCKPNLVVGVGGYNSGNGGPFIGRADVIAGYSGALNDMEGGIGALAKAVNDTRAACPGSALTLAGHSQGAAIVHVYLSRNGLANGNAVLYADPKQAGTGQSDDLFRFGGYPIAGTDANFRGVPTVSICNRDDVICNRAAGWGGYFSGAHGRYNFDARAYAGKTGVIWL